MRVQTGGGYSDKIYSYRHGENEIFQKEECIKYREKDSCMGTTERPGSTQHEDLTTIRYQLGCK